MLDSGLTDVAAAALKKAHSYIEQSQVRRCWSCASSASGFVAVSACVVWCVVTGVAAAAAAIHKAR
jgi:hypothetical protein